MEIDIFTIIMTIINCALLIGIAAAAVAFIKSITGSVKRHKRMEEKLDEIIKQLKEKE